MREFQAKEAPPAGSSANLARTLRQASLFWLVFFAGAPALLYALEPALALARFRFASPAWQAAGALLFIAAGAVNLASAYSLAAAGKGTPLPTACPRRLVVSGPYRYLRNPMAASALAQGAAVGLYLGSPLVVLYAAAGAAFWQFCVRPWEEADLGSRFGDGYRRYRAGVRCWIPRLRGYRDPAQRPGTSPE